MSYTEWLEDYQSLDWSEYCKLDPEEKEMLREEYKEWKEDVYWK